MLGSRVQGVVDSRFEFGYFVTMNVHGEEMRGALPNPLAPASDAQSRLMDIAALLRLSVSLLLWLVWLSTHGVRRSGIYCLPVMFTFVCPCRSGLLEASSKPTVVTRVASVTGPLSPEWGL